MNLRFGGPQKKKEGDLIKWLSLSISDSNARDAWINSYRDIPQDTPNGGGDEPNQAFDDSKKKKVVKSQLDQLNKLRNALGISVVFLQPDSLPSWMTESELMDWRGEIPQKRKDELQNLNYDKLIIAALPSSKNPKKAMFDSVTAKALAANHGWFAVCPLGCAVPEDATNTKTVKLNDQNVSDTPLNEKLTFHSPDKISENSNLKTISESAAKNQNLPYLICIPK